MSSESGYYECLLDSTVIKAFFSAEHQLWHIDGYGWVTYEWFDEINETRILAPDEQQEAP